jgi:predicted lipopolysaccharide heptosyltransferase III
MPLNYQETGETASVMDRAERVLLVRLRSIGDTVLMTPCLAALKSWRPEIEIDVLVESLSAPILRAHPQVDRLFVLPAGGTRAARLRARLQIISELRSRRYDLAFNMHGGTTATFFTRLAGARLSFGYGANQYSRLLSGRAPGPDSIWQKPQIHCVEQQLGLLKWAGIPVATPLPLSLSVEPSAAESVRDRLHREGLAGSFAIVHPAAAFESKQWQPDRFARAVEYIYDRYRLPSAVAVAPDEVRVADMVMKGIRTPATVFSDLDLAQLMALIERSAIFLGNDSGPAHIAAAFGKPVAVIFGSSNAKVWHPWSQAPYRLLRQEMPCAPCPGYTCSEFPEPECIKRVSVDEVIAALDELI